jgi:uncharacterized membrane protein
MTMKDLGIDTARPHPAREAALWLLIGCILALGIGFSWNATPFAQFMAAVFIACALVHAGVFYTWRTASAFFLICIVITFIIENIGTTTGFPFGRYHFEVGAGLPYVGRIPIIVGPLWFGGGYFSWVVASTLLDGADRRLDRKFNFFALPVVAAFVMTQWDLVMDPPSATIARAWIWHDGGADFGVPLSNYFGWLFTSWLFFQAFAVYLRRRQADPPQSARTERKLRLIAILFYVSAGLTHVLPWLIGQSGEVVDAAGHVWQVRDLRETAVAVMVFTMFFSALLAALRLAGERSSE